MVIETSTTNPTNSLSKRLIKSVFTFTAYGLLIAFGIVTTIAAIGSGSRTPTGTYLSPIPKGELAQVTPNPTPTGAEPIKTTPELINLAQNYLNKAFDLAKTPNQTPEQKDTIMANIDQSLSLATQAISQDPRNPNGYVLRAQILTAVSSKNPNALTQAQKDLETAQDLSQGQPITLPETVNPLNLLPDQQALASSDLILAAPLPGQVLPEQNLDVASNTFSTQITIPAGQTEVPVTDQRISGTSYIYLIPTTKTNNSVFVKSKGQGQFVLSTSTPSNIDLIINYYIINP